MSLSLKSVLITDEIDAKCIKILENSGISVLKNTKFSKEELLVEIAKYDGLIVRSATKVTADVINAGKNLKIIGRAGSGVDNIDCEAATSRGIIVMNTPGGNTLSAAEHTCTLICALSRHIARGDQAMKAEKWSERKALMGSELYGKTLAIVGLGRIGKEVALRMQSFGMTTIGFDPLVPPEVSQEFGVESMPLEKIWPLADYITVHTPLIPQTRNLINDKVFSICKKGMKVVNVARGGIIDEEALFRALESGQCGGAGLDVYIQEPPKDFTLAKHPKVIATPHLGASTTEAQERVAVEIAEQFVDVAQGKQLFGAINAPALTNALSPDARPWVELGERLGVLAATINSASSDNLQVTTYGSSLKKAGSYVSAAVLSGLLRNSSQQGSGDAPPLNLVSAPALAKANGINKTEQQLERKKITLKGFEIVDKDHHFLVFCDGEFLEEQIIAKSSVVSERYGDEDLNIVLPLEVKTSHEELAPSPYTNLVTLTLSNGCRLSGTTSGGNSLLVEVQGQQFSAPASLSGSVLIFSGTGNSKLLPTVAGALGSAGVAVTSLSTSAESNGQTWGVATFAKSVTSQCVESLKSVVSSAVVVSL